jgi:hypothetical protein
MLRGTLVALAPSNANTNITSSVQLSFRRHLSPPLARAGEAEVLQDMMTGIKDTFAVPDIGDRDVEPPLAL